jgi:integrase
MASMKKTRVPGVYKRGGTYTIMVELDRDEKGKRRQKAVGGFKTLKTADTERRRLLGIIDAGGDAFPEAITTAAYIDRWLDHHKSRVRPGTWKRADQLLRTHVVPHIGRVEIAKVRPAHVQLCLDEMQRRGLAPATRIQAHAVLGSAFRQAVEWGLVSANPVRAVRRPRRDRRPTDPPTVEELHRLLEVAESTVWAEPLALAIGTGCRRGEGLAVRWSDLNLATGRLRITRSLQVVEHTLRFVEPKTDRARREVTLPGFVLERLKRHKKAQAERRLALGTDWHDDDRVCERGDGAPLHPDSFSTAFKRLARRAGLRSDVSLHGVRHAYATTMLAGGVHPAIASAVLGHSNPAFTMSQYQHVLDGMSDQAAAAIEEAFGVG